MTKIQSYANSASRTGYGNINLDDEPLKRSQDSNNESRKNTGGAVSPTVENKDTPSTVSQLNKIVPNSNDGPEKDSRSSESYGNPSDGKAHGNAKNHNQNMNSDENAKQALIKKRELEGEFDVCLDETVPLAIVQKFLGDHQSSRSKRSTSSTESAVVEGPKRTSTMSQLQKLSASESSNQSGRTPDTGGGADDFSTDTVLGNLEDTHRMLNALNDTDPQKKTILSSIRVMPSSNSALGKKIQAGIKRRDVAGQVLLDDKVLKKSMPEVTALRGDSKAGVIYGVNETGVPVRVVYSRNGDANQSNEWKEKAEIFLSLQKSLDEDFGLDDDGAVSLVAMLRFYGHDKYRPSVHSAFKEPYNRFFLGMNNAAPPSLIKMIKVNVKMAGSEASEKLIKSYQDNPYVNMALDDHGKEVLGKSASKFEDKVGKPILNFLQEKYPPRNDESAGAWLARIVSSPEMKEFGTTILADLGWYGGAEGEQTAPGIREGLVLNAMAQSLDPPSQRKDGYVAGYQFNRPDNWGRSYHEIRSDFVRSLDFPSTEQPSLIAQTKAIILSPYMPPDFKVRDIPESLRYGTSPEWVNFIHGVLLAETFSPRSSEHIPFEDLNDFPAQLQAIIDETQDPAEKNELAEVLMISRVDPANQWAMTQGIIPIKNLEDVSFDESEMAALELDNFIEKMKQASIILASPPNRIEMAKDAIERWKSKDPSRLKDIDPTKYMFGRKLSRRGGLPVNAKPHSLVDLVAAGQLHNDGGNTSWRNWLPFNKRIDMKEFSEIENVNDKFNKEFDVHLRREKKEYGFLTTALLTQLPLDERSAIEHGNVSLYSLRDGSKREHHDPNAEALANEKYRQGFILRVEYGGKIQYYEIFPLRQEILKIPQGKLPDDLPLEKKPFGYGHRTAPGEKFEILNPAKYLGGEPDGKGEVFFNKIGPDYTPNNFGEKALDQTSFVRGGRLSDIGNRIGKDHFYRSDAQHKAVQAGESEYEKDTAEAIDLLKNIGKTIVPFWGPIEELASGDPRRRGAGIGGLFLDSIGFAPGIGKFLTGTVRLTSKIEKIGVRATLPKFGGLLKKLGKSAFSNLNPFDGIPQFGVAAVRVGRKGITKSSKWLSNYRIGKGGGQIGVENLPIRNTGTIKSPQYHAIDPYSGKPVGFGLSVQNSNIDVLSQYSVTHVEPPVEMPKNGIFTEKGKSYQGGEGQSYILDSNGNVYQVKNIRTPKQNGNGYHSVDVVDPNNHNIPKARLYRPEGTLNWKTAGLPGGGIELGRARKGIEYNIEDFYVDGPNDQTISPDPYGVYSENGRSFVKTNNNKWFEVDKISDNPPFFQAIRGDGQAGAGPIVKNDGKDRFHVVEKDGVSFHQASPEDLGTYKVANGRVQAMDVQPIYDPNDENSRLFVASFDGTGNNADETISGRTNVAEITEQIRLKKDKNIHTHYIEGPGTQRNKFSATIDQITGRTFSRRLEDMYAELTRQAQKWYNENPNITIGVMNIGFSRGGEQAAGFARLLHDRGLHVVGKNGGRVNLFDGGRVKQGAILFDPVGTGTPHTKDRSIPESMASGVQINAMDEWRDDFKNTKIINNQTEGQPFLSVNVSGAHSDVGGGYAVNGLSRKSGNLGVKYFKKATNINLPALPVPTSKNMYTIHHSEEFVNFPGSSRRGVVYTTDEYRRSGFRVSVDNTIRPTRFRLIYQ
ncbi:phospholipase effector Tle1 domain-containing protein [Burkholderia ubonensis]|uniref:phospholipase effector Tle1 domain-containing protein n=1 Tax=Burkholderia ubonensis TaxID=101571 RepID=UPI0009B3A09C|nr:DUF2235 domain-containing protein [Burkholderia ubonensis]